MREAAGDRVLAGRRPPLRASAGSRKPSFNVYVVRLDDRVMEDTRFAKANPGHRRGKPCVYVGRTGLSPKERLRKHRQGHKASRFVRNFGQELMPELYESLNPMSYEASTKMEVQLAERLRDEGYAVWQR